MNLRNIGLFVDVCGLGSFTRVAKKNYMTVQSVSRAASNMEREAGFALFERLYTGVCPTEVGRRLLPSAKLALRAWAAWEAEVGRTRAVSRARAAGGTGTGARRGRE